MTIGLTGGARESEAGTEVDRTAVPDGTAAAHPAALCRMAAVLEVTEPEPAVPAGAGPEPAAAGRTAAAPTRITGGTTGAGTTAAGTTAPEAAAPGTTAPEAAPEATAAATTGPTSTTPSSVTSGPDAPEPEQDADPALALQLARRQRWEAMISMWAAERAAAVAAARYEELRERRCVEPVPPADPRRWRTLMITVVGVGEGLAVLWLGLLVVAYLSPGPLFLLPTGAALYAVVRVTLRVARVERAPRRPVVDDLVDAVREVRAAELTVRQARSAAARWADRTRRARAEAVSWCVRHHLPADAVALRELAAGAERQAPARASLPRGREAVRMGAG
jgi:hypothetical protein